MMTQFYTYSTTEPKGQREYWVTLLSRTLVLAFCTLLLGSLSLVAQTGEGPGPGTGSGSGSGTESEPGRDSTQILVPLPGNDGTRPSGTGSSIFVDSIYFDGEMIRFTVRVADEIRRDSLRLRALIDSMENSQSARLAANLRLDPSEWQPTVADKARKEEELALAQDREWIYHDSKVTRIPVFSAPVGAIARSLGLIEDVTPRISYSIARSRTITVTIYTLSALKINTLVDGVQKPGEYSFDWDFLDSTGRRVVTGSYFAEVIADGNELLLRKRIEVP